MNPKNEDLKVRHHGRPQCRCRIVRADRRPISRRSKHRTSFYVAQTCSAQK